MLCRSPMHQKCSSRLKDAKTPRLLETDLQMLFLFLITLITLEKGGPWVFFCKVQCFQKTAMEGRYGWVRQIVVLPWIGEGKE